MIEIVRISASGFAELVLAKPASRARKLRPFKFSNGGEGAGRSAYYRCAVRCIREYHRQQNDPAVLDRTRQELMATSMGTASRTQRIRSERNLSAIDAYERIYGARRFNILPNRRLSYALGPVVVTVQPDLCVEENGTQLLIKLGVSKRTPVLVELMLTIMRKGAVANGLRIRARNILYLDIRSGGEYFCSDRLSRFNRTFALVAQEIAALWPTITEPERRPAQSAGLSAVSVY